MKRILRSRLPERFADKVPPLLVELAIGIIVPLALTLARMALMPWTGDHAPFAFVFIAAVGATVFAGWRSGILSVIIGQLLAWFLIVDPASYELQKAQYIGGFASATFAQLVAVGIIALYQNEVDRAWSRREAQVDLLHHALVEIDHRTVNNYQTVLSLILAQAKRADPPVREALQQVADRIKAIALASKQLALSSDSLEEVRVTNHLGELCSQIRHGLSRPGVRVTCQFDDVSIDPEQAVAMSVLVNELVTNALKHAFPDDRQGEIRVSLGKSDKGLILEVADDGVGMKGGTTSRGTGLGTRLVDTFTRQLHARHEIETGEGGTRHRIHFPLAA
ncbi:MAG TPA: sensor histidine kinase [Sphingomicrobium sp.]|nr:sensor histidine kinase [Sphingomicrobium sp.]